MKDRDFKTKLERQATRVKLHSSNIATEEATKNALIMPLIDMLGYDVFDPLEVVPEHTADILDKKGEKVDYAIFDAGQVSIIIECKSCKFGLNRHNIHQLYRYFPTVSAKIAILTNGITWMFFSDIQRRNIMDTAPFFVFDLKEYTNRDVAIMQSFRKENFDATEILGRANSYMHRKQVHDFLRTLITDPPTKFVQYITASLYRGRRTKKVVDEFKGLIVDEFSAICNELGGSSMSVDVKVREPHKSDLHINSKSVDATGRDINGRFVVQVGSLFRRSESSSLPKGPKKLRAQLITEGALIYLDDKAVLQLTKDYAFKSPSYAAAVVLGRAANAREWKESKR